MNNTTRPHAGYIGSVEVDMEAGQLYGKILHVQDLVTFCGATPEALQAAFVEAVDDYLATCEALGKSPDKPFSGVFQVRMAGDLHRTLACEAAAAGRSLNDWVVQKLSATAESVQPTPGVNLTFNANVSVLHVVGGASQLVAPIATAHQPLVSNDKPSDYRH